ncbi:unnamed protein product [Closterium sp. NIES-65]|nr:unnamed protein product [Closterium sp. NIES-65]
MRMRPRPSRHPSRPLAAPSRPRPRPFAAPSPPLRGPDAALRGLVADLRGPVAAPIGPVATLRGPVAASSGPVAALRGPVAAPIGSVAALCGPVAAPSGPVAALGGPSRPLLGPVVALRGPIATLPGPSSAPPPPTAAAASSSGRHHQQQPTAADAADNSVGRHQQHPSPPTTATAAATDSRSCRRCRGSVPADAPRLCPTACRPLPTSLGDHFLSVCPTRLTVDLLEERLLAAEKSIVAVGASRGDPRAPVFEKCSPNLLLPSVASTTAVNYVGTESVGAASAPSGRRRTGKGKGDKGAGGAGGGDGGVAVFDLDYDAILAAMYVVSTSDSGDCYLCVPPDPRTVAAALGAGEVAALSASASAAPGAGESALLGLYLPSFSTNLVSGANLQDGGFDQFTPPSQRVTHCTCARMGRHLATFTRQPGSSLYTLTTESPPVAESGQVAVAGQVFAATSRACPYLHCLHRGAAARL